MTGTPLTWDEWAEMQEHGAGLSLSPRQRDVLSSIAHQTSDAWLRPMDIGGRDGSHHSDTLRSLIKLGLVEKKKYHAIYCCFGTRHVHVVNHRGKMVKTRKPIQICRCKGSCRYRATSKGRKLYTR